MKKKTDILLLCILASLMLAMPLAGQDRETIKEKKIASRTVHEYFLEQGMNKAVIESIEKYDAYGNLTEIKEFNSKGEVKLWEEYTYNEEGKVTEARYFNAKGKLESREKNIYSDGLRIEKLFYNNKDKLVKRKVYEYEYRD